MQEGWHVIKAAAKNKKHGTKHESTGQNEQKEKHKRRETCRSTITNTNTKKKQNLKEKNTPGRRLGSDDSSWNMALRIRAVLERVNCHR